MGGLERHFSCRWVIYTLVRRSTESAESENDHEATSAGLAALVALVRITPNRATTEPIKPTGQVHPDTALVQAGR